MRRESVHQTVNGLHGIVRVQGGDHQMPRLRGGERSGNGIQIADLADEDHVGRLAQDVAERVGETLRIKAHFALLHHGTLALVNELDGVLNSDNVAAPAGIDETASALPKNTSPDPNPLYTDYILQRPGKPYCRIQDKNNGPLHLESTFQYRPLASME